MTAPDPGSTLEFALRYATELGCHVFPVAPAPAKRPLTPHGFRDATTDADQITEWWQRWPNAQIGVACGASGLVFLDIDVKNDVDGRHSLGELEMEHEAHGSGLVMSTPGGGFQVAFLEYEHRCGRRQGVRPGIDVLGDGGYTIVPSPASPGREWIKSDPFDDDVWVPVPRWVPEVAPRRTRGQS